MTIQFPDSPTQDQSFVATNGVSYTYDKGGWIANSQLGLDDRFVNVDGDSMTGDLTVPSLNGGQLAGFRNQLINGDFRVYQRGINFPTDANNKYTLDRWYSIQSNGTITRSNTEGPEGQAFSLQIAPDGSSQRIYQAIELPRKGYAGPFTVNSVWTLSFYAKVFSGTMQVTPTINFGDNVAGENTSQSQSGSSVTITDTWQKFSTTFTIGGAPDTTNRCFRVLLLENGIGPSSLFYSMIQLEAGPVATPFENRPIGTELALCQRYYQTQSRLRLYPGSSTNLLNRFLEIPRPVVMRVAPTESSTPGASVNGLDYYQSTADIMGMLANVNAADDGAIVTNYSADAEL